MQECATSRVGKCILKCKPNEVPILSTTRVGLAAAQKVFTGSGAIILQVEECDYWFSKVYPIDFEARWWYWFADWSIHEGLEGWVDEHGKPFIRRNYPIPEGSSYWFVVYGTQHGGLCGSHRQELWRWDGCRAEFMDVYSLSIS
jgi:hypothetical protein